MKAEITLVGTTVKVKTDYAPAVVDRFRLIPGRKWCADEKAWTFPAVKDTLLMVCDAVGQLPWMLPQELRTLANGDDPLAIERVALDESIIKDHVFRIKPFAHQRKNVARLVQNGRWILADEQGTGKTFAVISAIQFLTKKFLIRSLPPILIVCPKSVMRTWQAQLAMMGISLDTHLIEGAREQRSRQITCPGAIISISNYELLILHEEDFLVRSPYFALVLDEIHRLKNFAAKTSRVARKISARAQCVFGLSGTPAPNGLEDWLGVLSAVNPRLLPVSTKTGFEARYCVKTRVGQGGFWKITGYRNVHELHSYIASVTSRVTKEECLDLPPKVISHRFVKLQGEQARVYRELKKDAVARLNAAATLSVTNVLSESLRLLQVIGGFVPDDTGRINELPIKAKLEALKDILDEAGDKRVIVWCAFKAEVYFLERWLEQTTGGKAVHFTGDCSMAERTDALDRFIAGDARYFVGTAAAGGTGIDGLQCCDTEVYYSRDWSYTNWSQSQDRIHRIGQAKNVAVIPIVAEATVDERIDLALTKKETMQSMMLSTKPEDLL